MRILESSRVLGVIVLLCAALLACGTEYDYDVPDTAANRDGFERHFGFAAPANVTDLYYFADELGADVKYQLGFEAGPETVADIVATLNLTQSDSTKAHGLNLAYDFPWWDGEDIQRATLYQKTNAEEDYWWELWYSEATGRVYYLEYSL